MNTTELVAGRELDALIAQKVMGWRNVAVVPATGEPWGIAETAFPSQHGSNPVPEYSTDIAAAWQVVEQMRHDGFVDVVITTGTDDGLWTVGIHRRDADWHLAFGDTSSDGRSKAPVAHDRSLPLAICRAALAAVE